MPDEEKKEVVKEEKKETKKEPMVDLDTSGPGAEVDLPEEKNKKEVEVKDDKSNDTTEKSSEQPTVRLLIMRKL